MSSEEQARILRMVSEGKISAGEGAGLLDALQPEGPPEQSMHPQVQSQVRHGGAFHTVPGPMPPSPELSRRSLVIHISEGGDSKVNVRIPLGLARAAGRFIPRQAQEYLDNYGIDLKELLNDLGNSLVEGPLIEIDDDEDSVRIAVE
ncbi:MAG: SHOCT-like domain-containing protein [Chloroflexota bacterium]|nr:MAG: hypothetical protein DLM70_07070 [Chloroflexota bacterium]